MSVPSGDKSDFSNRDRWLTLAFVLGPMAPLASLTASYVLTPTACAQDSKTMLHVATLGFLAISLISALIGWRILQDRAPAMNALAVERTRWLAIVCVALALGGALVIVAFEIPNLILRSCQ